MSLLIATDIRIYTKGSRYYLASQMVTIVKRYYEEFGPIVFYSRKSEFPENVELFDVTDMMQEVIIFDSLLDTFKMSFDKKLCMAIKKSDLVVGRFHSLSGCQAARCAKKVGKPFLAEVMGDAFDGYWNHGIRGKIVAPIIYNMTKYAIRNANYGLYVTEHFLQNKYPCEGESISASNVKINVPDSSCLEERLNKISSADLSHISMMTSAGVDVEAKGQRYVIEAIPALNSKGIRVSYFLAGGGDKTKLEEFAKSLGVLDQVCFLGRLKHEEILEKLQKIDFYIQPSLQEGLPRSVIEAMAYACPVLGAKTAGIPELIDEKCVFKRKSSYDIVSTLINNLNKEEMMDCAKNNFEKSKKYEEHVLNNRRKDFFDKIKKYL